MSVLADLTVVVRVVDGAVGLTGWGVFYVLVFLLALLAVGR
jgi:hypothetical protein